MTSLKNCKSSSKITVKPRRKIKHKEKKVAPPMKHASATSTMSSKTRDFIERICCRKSSSVDMTKYGFINDKKSQIAYVLIAPLREKLKKIVVVKQKTKKNEKRIPKPKFEEGVPYDMQLQDKNKVKKKPTK